MKRIMFTHAGGRIGIGFARAMRAAPEPFYLIGLDADRYHIQRGVADEKHLLPRAKDRDFIPVLRALIHDLRPDLLWVQHEGEMAVVSAAADTLGVPIFLPPEATIHACQDKMASYQAWAGAVPVPHSVRISTPDDLRRAFAEVSPSLWLRALTGAGGKGSLGVADFEKACRWIDFHQGWGKFMAAKRLGEKTVTWESVWDHGRLLAAQGRRRLYWEFAGTTFSGITGVGGAHEWVSDPVVDGIGLKAVKAVAPEPHGVLSVDMTYDENDQPHVTEINAGRFMSGGSVCFTREYNLPYLAVKAALGEELPYAPPLMNPFPQDVVLIHGIDVEPVIAHKAEIEAIAEELERRRTAEKVAAA